MAKTKFFRVATSGATTDGRNIKAQDLEDMAATYAPATYGARVNLEHLMSAHPDSAFGAHGDVLALKTEPVTLTIGGKQETRTGLYAARIAEVYGVDPSVVGTTHAQYFAVPNDEAEQYAAGATPSVEQRLVERMQDTSEFLKLINIIGVDELIGDTVGLEMVQSVIARSNPLATNPPTRIQPVDPTGLDNVPYQLYPTEFNIAFPYAKIDAWAKFPNFQSIMQSAVLKRMGLDRIKVGWNGVAAGTTADPVADPTLAQQNIGWLQLMRNNRASQVMTQGSVNNKVTYGVGGDYENLDALAYDAAFELLPVYARNDPNLVVLVGGEMLHDKYFLILNQNNDPLNQLATDAIFASQRLGKKMAMRVPDIPNGTMIITRLDNLSLYYQTGHMHRRIADEPEYKRMADYQTGNEGYAIEDYSYTCVIENIQPFGSAAPTAAELLNAGVEANATGVVTGDT